MSVTRHQYILVLVALLDKFIEENLDGIYYLLEFVAGKELQIHEYLVVA